MSRVHTTADGRRCALARPCRSYLAPAARVRAASARIEDTQTAPPFPGLPIRGWKYGLAPPSIGITERGWNEACGNAPPRLACHVLPDKRAALARRSSGIGRGARVRTRTGAARRAALTARSAALPQGGSARKRGLRKKAGWDALARGHTNGGVGDRKSTTP